MNSTNEMSTPRMSEDEISSRLVPVILGGDVLAYSYVREFNRVYGIDRCIVVLADDIKMLTSSRFADCRIVPGAGDADVLADALTSIASELSEKDPALVPLVVGTDDRHAVLLSSLREVLEPLGFVIPYETIEKMEWLSDKHSFYDICDELDIPHPKTWYFNCGDAGPCELPLEDLPIPLIAKPADSAKYKQAKFPDKRKAYEIYDKSELVEIWKNIRASEYDGEFIIQEFIPGDDGALWILSTFTDSTGDVRVVTNGHLLLQDHCPSAIGNPITILGQRSDKLIEYARRFQAYAKFHGWSVFDIKQDPRTNEFVFFEINIRAGRSSYYISLAGKSFVEPIVEEFVLGRSVAHVEAYKPFVYNLVPKYVLKRSIKNKKLLNKVLDTLKITDPNPYALHYSKDTLTHNFWAAVMKLNQIRKFKRYYWDTGGRQVKGN